MRASKRLQLGACSWHPAFMLPLDPRLLLVLLALLLALVLVVVLYAAQARWRTYRRRRTAALARQGERRAVALLEARGYAIEAEQPTQPWPVLADERRYTITLRADYLVRYAGQRFVAEVKTGDLVASIRHGPTRRQLLEYQLAYAVAGVVLVDVRAGSVRRVRFTGSREDGTI